jgi:hypothetical protein
MFENPVGRGRVFRGSVFVAEVDYDLKVNEKLLNPGRLIGPIITGRIRRIDGSNVLWGSELLTLHLSDQRKLDFICVNYDPDCNIASDRKFYT